MLQCRLCQARAILGGLCPDCWNQGPDHPESRPADFRQNGKRKWRKPRPAFLEDLTPPPVKQVLAIKQVLDLHKPDIDALMWWAPLNPRQVRRFSNLRCEDEQQNGD
jgi:hypothetical protein